MNATRKRLAPGFLFGMGFGLALAMPLVSCVATGKSPEGDGADWLNPPPAGSFLGADARDVDEVEIREVAVSKLVLAEFVGLKDRGHVALTSDEARSLIGPGFSCPQGKKPYLVRAVYGHGGTGRYDVKREGRRLLVWHESLGRSNPAHKSALIVNLDDEPESVYTVVSIAE